MSLLKISIHLRKLLFSSGVFLFLVLATVVVLQGNKSYAANDNHFGGKVEEYIYCQCTRNWFLKVGDPVGGKFIQNNQTKLKDCGPPVVGGWTLGMATWQMERCVIRVRGVCVQYDQGYIIDYYGNSSLGGCNSGLGGAAAGEDKEEMVTPDNRQADGENDTALESRSGEKAEEGNEEMITPDGQNAEGDNTTKMVTYQGHNANNGGELEEGGSGDGYSPAGGGHEGQGEGSVGGSVGSEGLESPVRSTAVTQSPSVQGEHTRRSEVRRKKIERMKRKLAARRNKQSDNLPSNKQTDLTKKDSRNKLIWLGILPLVGGLYFIGKAVLLWRRKK